MSFSSSTSPSVSDRPVTSRAAAAVLGLALGLFATFALNLEARAQAPGPESFGKPPTTPLELWDAADYLVRTGPAAQAVPYLNRFLKSEPDDDTLMKIRDRYGVRSILRLQDYPETRALAEPLATKLGEATRRHATRPDRIARFIGDLTKSREEQDYAVERLRDAGPYAVPALLQEVSKSPLDAEVHALLVRNMGRLDRSAVPALIAALDPAAVAARPGTAADAAETIGRIGDPRAIPALTALGGSTDPAVSVVARDAARRSVERITGRPFDQQPKSPTTLLTDEANRYHRHEIKFPGDSVVVWVWDPASESPAPQTMTRSEAEAHLGLSLSRAALAIDPAFRPAQVVLISIALEKAIERAGFNKYPANDPSNTFAAALAAGPSVLGDVLRTAIADGKDELAAVAATALGKVTDANALGTIAAKNTLAFCEPFGTLVNAPSSVNPLIEALSAPGRRARFAAARALVLLDPRRPFAGSSRVVPVLIQFVSSQAAPRALVIDGNTSRGNQLTGLLHSLGFDPVLARTGDEGFRIAADSADIELILVDNHLVLGNWRLHDTLANLRADARTAGIPIYVVGPLERETDLHSLLTERFPGVRFLVTPTDPQILDRQLAIVGRPVVLPAEDRAGYAREAAALLATIAERPNSPFEGDLVQAEPALSIALNVPGTSLPASAALGDVPDQNAQRSLADVLIDPAKPKELRLSAAGQLARSLQRFGPLVAADQEPRLLTAFDSESDPALRTALGTVIGALRPKAVRVGERLRLLGPGASNVPPASPSPEATPAPEPATEVKP